LFSFAMICVGTLIGLAVRTAESAQGIGFVLIFPLTFASNTFVPTGGMPAPLRFVAQHSPVTTLVAALRDLFGNPNPIPADASWNLLHPIAASLLWCASLAVVGLAGATWLYARRRRH